jgi:hypothetical protein
MNPEVQKSWEDFLNPDVMRSRLISASVYITAFEMLQDSIVGRIRDFFTNGFDERGDILDPKYKSDVLHRNPSPVYASLDWLKERGAIDEPDLAIFQCLKICRNHLTHELFTVLGKDGLPSDFKPCFREMAALLRKIEMWWIQNVEIPTNSDPDGKNIDYEGIVPGPIITLQLLCDIAPGSDEQSRVYMEAFKLRLGDQDA